MTPSEIVKAEGVHAGQTWTSGGTEAFVIYRADPWHVWTIGKHERPGQPTTWKMDEFLAWVERVQAFPLTDRN